MVKQALNIDNTRTGRNHDIPISDGAITAIDVKQIKDSSDDLGLLSYHTPLRKAQILSLSKRKRLGKGLLYI